MKKKLVLFALSWRNQDVCVAGKDLFTKEWIRPVTEAGPVPKSDVYKFRLGDIVEIEISNRCAKGHQTENYRLAGNSWRKTGDITPANLRLYFDKPKNIWDYKTHVGHDRLPSADLASAGITNSLFLIEVPQLTVEHEIKEYLDTPPRHKHYGRFTYSGVEYRLSITDPVFTAKYPQLGTYNIAKAALCLSLTEPFAVDNKCYKLIAGVIA